VGKGALAPCPPSIGGLILERRARVHPIHCGEIAKLYLRMMLLKLTQRAEDQSDFNKAGLF
jgi:hypothetical protein